jgi:hypothetical protein
MQESGKGRLPALSPQVIGQQLSGYPDFIANTLHLSATRKIQYELASCSGPSPAKSKG